jgi:Rad3-related DNA helicase
VLGKWMEICDEVVVKFPVFREGKQLTPLVTTSGKTQVDIVDEILVGFRQTDMVILKAVVGSGKSIISALVAKELGGAIIVVPTKALQEQYFEDYGSNKITIEGVSIGFIQGRANHQCMYDVNKNCNDKNLPCTRKLEEGEKRSEVGKECPHFCIINNEPILDRHFINFYEYNATSRRFGVINFPDDPCPYSAQFFSYAQDDITILNEQLFKIDARIGRLPRKPIVVDECDAFLDGLTLKTTFTDYRLSKLKKESQEGELGDFESLESAFNKIQGLKGLYEDITSSEIGLFLDNLKDFLTRVDTEYTQSYLAKLEMVEEFEDSCAFIEWPKIHFFIPEPAFVLKSILNSVKNKMLLMSATLQNHEVLREVYGLYNYKYVKGETKIQGTIIPQFVPGKIFKINYDHWQKDMFRKNYFEAIEDYIDSAQRPLVIPVFSHKYLPEGIECNGNQEEFIQKFKDGEINILWSTKIKRGADFPNAKSLMLLKYPYPPNTDPVLQTMKKKLGYKRFNMFYFDLANREFIQSLGRCLRSPDQVIKFYSPDIKCHQELPKTGITLREEGY